MEKTPQDIRIMFVDRDPLVRDSLKTFFHRSTATPRLFKSGSDGLTSLKNYPADIVVSDYFLPDMDGITFLIRANQINGGAVRVLTATLGDPDMEEQCRQNGIDRFIEKPLNGDTLEGVLNDLMKQVFGDEHD